MTRFVPTGSPRVGISNAVNARMPPSPWLSARITNSRYLTEMITTRAQNTTDATPYALALVTARSACSNDSRKAYSGLVPMSPYTIPNAEAQSDESALIAAVSALKRRHCHSYPDPSTDRATPATPAAHGAGPGQRISDRHAAAARWLLRAASLAAIPRLT